MAVTSNYNGMILEVQTMWPRNWRMPAVAGQLYYRHVAIVEDATGRGAVLAAVPGQKPVGIYMGAEFTATADDVIEVRGCVAQRKISSTDPVTIADDRRIVYAEDAHTIARTSAGGTLTALGMMHWIEGRAYAQIGALPASIAASSGLGSTGLSLFAAREVTSGGDVANIAGIGGVLASDTSPILRADTAESVEISWATGNVDPIGWQVTLPDDVDGSAPITLDLWGYSGTTDAMAFTVETSWNGGALVSDTIADTAAATVHKMSATIAAADVPDGPNYLSVFLTPPTHATDAFNLVAARFTYRRR